MIGFLMSVAGGAISSLVLIRLMAWFFFALERERDELEGEDS